PVVGANGLPVLVALHEQARKWFGVVRSVLRWSEATGTARLGGRGWHRGSLPRNLGALRRIAAIISRACGRLPESPDIESGPPVRLAIDTSNPLVPREGTKDTDSGQVPRIAYQTRRGLMIEGRAEDAFKSSDLRRFRRKAQLIFTSPPFPLNRKKRYG